MWLRVSVVGCLLAFLAVLLVGLGVVIGRLLPSAGGLDDVAKLAKMLDDPEGYADDIEGACLDRGDPDACASLGVHYAFGTYGRERDYAQARRHLSTACEAGHAYGCLDLGVLYMYARGVEADHARAAELFEVACEGGAANGCHYLGDYWSGRHGHNEDLERARGWYAKACEAGSQSSCEAAEGR